MSEEEIIEINQEKEINEEKQDNEEKEEKDLKEDKDSSQGDQDIQKDQQREERIEEIEEHMESQEPQENNEQEPELIIFSNLSKEEKIKYFNYFIANDTTFNREEEGTWIAEIEILDEAKLDTKSSNNLILSAANSSESKSLRQSKFRSTKKDYDTIYSKLISVINPPPGVKGAKMDINAMKYMIQEIYSLKFLKDTQALLSKEEKEPEAFPTFVGNFLLNKFSKKEMLYKKSIDFMLSLDFYGMKHKDIKVFQQFVTEEYDSDDLIFYLFVRSCIEKEQKQFFLERAKENLGQGLLYGQEDDDILVPVKKCKKLAKAIFGNDEEELMNKFLENIQTLIETEPADDKKKYLKANSILNMALLKYHESRDKIDEENDDKNGETEEIEEKDKKGEKEKEIKLKEKPKTILKKPKAKEEKVKFEDDSEEDENPKLTSKKLSSKSKAKEEEDDSEDSQKEEFNIEQNNIIEGETPPSKKITKKKNNIKPSIPSNPKSKVKISTKPKNTSIKQPKTTISKPSTSIRVSNPSTKINSNISGSKITIGKGTTNVTSKVNKTGIFNNPKINSKTTVRPARQTSAETRSNKLRSGNKTQNTSVGKRNVKKNIHNFSLEENKIEQTPEFKKILNKNRIEKVKLESEKSACLCYIISDYFKLKELDPYFKNIIEQNPIFQPLSAKIYANLKNPKEFLIKKLNGICKYISIGDKNGFYNFLKIKDKNGKSNFEGFKSSFNSLLKGPLKDLNENDVSNFCKSILEMPELSFQTSKSLLKLCE